MFLTINYRVVSIVTVAPPRAQLLPAKSREREKKVKVGRVSIASPVTRSLRGGIVVVIRPGSIGELRRVWDSYKPTQEIASRKPRTSFPHIIESIQETVPRQFGPGRFMNNGIFSGEKVLKNELFVASGIIWNILLAH